ncbi:nucleotidyltransferase family protein [Dyella sp.]|uniref:nucleotidyltransferase family protein n=1 Tax=Dyella sp. TaxID=1869338 RepID=UPI002B4807D0|nr:nucleotidyltransferase family protein [Dyella sp.]HKT28441.1 nucleotidyltransferase family protein [Dyella sp.]
MHYDSPVILLLAAGEGSRFGGAKQLAEIAGEPMVRRSARVLMETDMPVLVVTGAYADDVEAVLDDLPLSMVRCEAWQLGMGHSLAAGVRAMAHTFPQASAVLVCLADQPLLDSVALQAMLQRHQAAPRQILASEHNGVQGPPALFPRDCFEALASLSGTHGARQLLRQEAARVELFSPPAWVDVDTPEDLQRIRAILAKSGGSLG